MLGFSHEFYQRLYLNYTCDTSFSIVGRSYLTQRTSVSSDTCSLFLNSDDQQFQLSYQLQPETQQIQRCLTHLPTHQDIFLKPIRMKSNYMMTADGIFDLQSLTYCIKNSNFLPYLLSEHEYIKPDKFRPGYFLLQKIHSETTQRYSIKEVFPIYVSKVQEPDYLISTQESYRRRREAIDTIDLAILQSCLPCYFAVSDATSDLVKKYYIHAVTSIQEALKIIHFAIHNQFDLLWNLTLQVTDSKLTNYHSSRLRQQSPNRLYFDIDETSLSKIDMLQTIRKYCPFSIEYITYSASGGYHLISEKLPTSITHQIYRRLTQHVMLQAFQHHIYVDRVSQLVDHFYFFPWIPIIKKNFKTAYLTCAS